jgi:hypothetical protein
MRDAVGFSVAGAGTTITVAREAMVEGAEPCHTTYAVVRDFAPGAGVIAVEHLQRQDGGGLKAAPMSTFEIPVLPMHHAGLSFGIVDTDLEDPSFQLVGSDSAVAELNGGRRRLYSVLLTPFVLGRRNVARWSGNPLQHVSPTIGLVVNDVASNALVGVTMDLPAATYITYGWHFGRRTQLHGSNPLGTSLKGTGRTIVTERPWSRGTFFAFSVDVRAAAELLKAVGGK